MHANARCGPVNAQYAVLSAQSTAPSKPPSMHLRACGCTRSHQSIPRPCFRKVHTRCVERCPRLPWCLKSVWQSSERITPIPCSSKYAEKACCVPASFSCMVRALGVQKRYVHCAWYRWESVPARSGPAGAASAGSCVRYTSESRARRKMSCFTAHWMTTLKISKSCTGSLNRCICTRCYFG